MSVESRLSCLESDIYRKADSYKLDAAKSEIRALKSELETERYERQASEDRRREMDERLTAVENALTVECPGCSQAAQNGVCHMPPLCPATPRPAWWRRAWRDLLATGIFDWRSF